MLVNDGLQEVAQHFLGHVEVGDHPILERPDRDDALGRAPEHALCFEPDSLDFSGRSLERHDRRLIKHDAFALDVNQGVGRAKIDSDLVRRQKIQEFPRREYAQENTKVCLLLT